MIIKNNDGTYNVKCNECNREIKFCPSIQLAMECQYDEG